MHPSRLRIIAALGLALVTALGVSTAWAGPPGQVRDRGHPGAHHAGPPPWAPAHGHRAGVQRDPCYASARHGCNNRPQDPRRDLYRAGPATRLDLKLNVRHWF
ncbi:MAG: hypothetical protein ACLFMW_08760 [Ectothiorhodospira sp.]